MHKHLIALSCAAVLGGASVAVLAQDGQAGARSAQLEMASSAAGRGDCGGRGAVRGGRRGGGPDVERLAVVLDLSDEQKAQLETLFQEQRAEREAIREAMREQMRTKMAGVLDEQQIAKLEALREMRGAHRRHGKRGASEG